MDLMCIHIWSKPTFFQSPESTRHGKTFDTQILVSWLPDLGSYAVSVWQPGDLNSRISGFSSEVDLLLDEFICRLKSGGLHHSHIFTKPSQKLCLLKGSKNKKMGNFPLGGGLKILKTFPSVFCLFLTSCCNHFVSGADRKFTEINFTFLIYS